jgi:hypothetical protein
VSKGKKILFVLVGLPILVLSALLVAWNTAISVGYLNLTFSLWWLGEKASMAMEYPVEPGQSVLVGLEDGQLVEQRRGPMLIKRKADGERLVIFDRGGGHLGVQGYVYAPDADDTRQVHEEAFGGFEGRELWYLYGSWWSYESSED